MNYFLGIDGGGTKTKVCIIDETLTLIAYGSAGPSSIDTVSNDVTVSNIQSAIDQALLAHPKITRFVSVFGGLGGIVTENDKHHVQTLLRSLSQVSDDTTIRIENDVINALASADRGLEGIVLISGTGMNCFGIDSHQSTYKAGGWGFKEGDAGSGYDLGYHAIKSMIRSFDGRYPMTEFSKAIASAVGLKQAEDIIGVMDRLWGDRTTIASLAPLVTKAANDGDLLAQKIIDDATDELALAVKTVYEHLIFVQPFVCVVGSLGNSEGYFKTQLQKKIKTINPEIELVAPKEDPAFAAAKLAVQFHSDLS